MKIEKLKKIPYINIYFAAVILNVATMLLPLIFRSVLPPVVPLLYGRPSGEIQLVSSLRLMLGPILAMGITIINFFLSSFLKEDFLKRVFSTAAITVSILSTITIVKIIFLVGFF